MSPILSLRPLQTQSDARLLALARDGHERAFESLVRRYRRQLLAYAGRLLGSEGRAEDALQHALMQAWLALRAGTEVQDARAWLYRIVHNSAVSTLRRPRHETVELNEAVDAPAYDPGPESRVLAGEVLQGLAALPDLQRRAMVLTAVRGDSHGEAAAAMGLTAGAVRGLIYRARSTMRDAVAGLLPIGLLNWTAGLGSRRTPGSASSSSELIGSAGGAGSAGLAAVVLKGGAAVVTAGALATAGQFALPKVFGHHHPAASIRVGDASRHLGPAPAALHSAAAPAGSGKLTRSVADLRAAPSRRPGSLTGVSDRGRSGGGAGDRSGQRHDGSGGDGRSTTGGSGELSGAGGSGGRSGSDGSSGGSGSGGSGSTSGPDGSGSSGGSDGSGSSGTVSSGSSDGGSGGGGGSGGDAAALQTPAPTLTTESGSGPTPTSGGGRDSLDSSRTSSGGDGSVTQTQTTESGKDGGGA